MDFIFLKKIFYIFLKLLIFFYIENKKQCPKKYQQRNIQFRELIIEEQLI